MTTMRVADLHVLTDELLERFRARAPVYDAESRLCSEDFEELVEAGYLVLAVPTELGGLGGTLAQECAAQRRLARYAPATALTTNTHLYWTGVAADLHRVGDRSLRWLLEEAVAGDVFASGHAEPGNDMALLSPTTRAERVEGGWRFTGHKIVASQSPVWTRLGIHGLDTADPDKATVVHAFLPRDAPGYRIVPTCDTLGMSLTRRDDAMLDSAVVPDRYVGRVVPIGIAEVDAFVLAISAWAQATVAAIHLGIAERAFELAVVGAKRSSSRAVRGRQSAHMPLIQHAMAEMAFELESMSAHIERVADDWSAGLDHGDSWSAKLAAVQHRATDGAQRIVDLALQVHGGAALFADHELERLWRDVRCSSGSPTGSPLPDIPRFAAEVQQMTADRAGNERGDQT